MRIKGFAPLEIANDCRKRKFLTGFTLIELLITSAIMALLSVAVLSVLAGGVNVYNRVRNLSGVRTDILFSLEKMERALRNTRNVSELEFKGDPKKLTFPSVVNVPSGRTEGLPVGSVSYYIDDSSHYLVSEERDYSAATAMEAPEGFITQLVYVSGIDFSYYYYDPETTSYEWKDNWVVKKAEEREGTDASKLGTPEETLSKEKLRVNTPLGVRIRLSYEDQGRPFVLERTVFFPLAVSLQFAGIAAEKEKKEEKNVTADEKKG